MKPVALVTGEVSPYRCEPFRMLAEAEGVEVIAFRGGPEPSASRAGAAQAGAAEAEADAARAVEAGAAGTGAAEPAGPGSGLIVHRTSERQAVRLVASGRYRAVIAGIGGRIALPGTYLAARRAGIPFVLWTSLWAHPRTPAHALSWLPTRHLYRHADAVVTYGRHVSAYVERHRARGNVFEAPQAVSAELFGTPIERVPNNSFRLLFVGRLEEEKGVDVLLEAWRKAGLGDDARLVFAGAGPLRPSGPGIELKGQVPRDQLPALYAAADALVLPSVRTATFLEPWGLVVNEAMHQGTPVIASDAVGAAAGGLVQDGRNGMVAPAGDAQALGSRIRALALNPELRERLGDAARRDVEPFSEQAWVDGMRKALRAVGAGREGA